jgi:hypothetical protein
MRRSGGTDEQESAPFQESDQQQSGAPNDRRGKRRKNVTAKSKKQSRAEGAKNRGTKNPENSRAAAVSISDLPVIASKRWYLTLSAAIAFVGSIVSTTYFVIDYVRIKPIEKDLVESRTLLSNAKTDAQNAKALLERAEQKSSELAAKFDRPAQIFPPDLSSVIGFNISFLWDYGKHDANTRDFRRQTPTVYRVRRHARRQSLA